MKTLNDCKWCKNRRFLNLYGLCKKCNGLKETTNIKTEFIKSHVKEVKLISPEN